MTEHERERLTFEQRCLIEEADRIGLGHVVRADAWAEYEATKPHDWGIKLVIPITAQR